jgi:hypothetical protein
MERDGFGYKGGGQGMKICNVCNENISPEHFVKVAERYFHLVCFGANWKQVCNEVIGKASG